MFIQITKQKKANFYNSNFNKNSSTIKKSTRSKKLRKLYNKDKEKVDYNIWSKREVEKKRYEKEKEIKPKNIKIEKDENLML